MNNFIIETLRITASDVLAKKILIEIFVLKACFHKNETKSK